MPKNSRGKVTINTKRIYMAGHSNGCMMSFAMALKHSDLVAAVCCHAGNVLTKASDDYNPRPMWFVHGMKDDVVPYEGSGTDLYFPGALDGFNYLSTLNGCNSTNTTVSFEEGNTRTASDCINDANIELMTLTDVEHRPYKNMETQVDTTLAAWEFCSSYELSDEPVLDEI